MKIRAAEEALELPEGTLLVIKDNVESPATLSDKYVADAARFLISRGDQSNFDSKAEVVARAINTYKWSLGKHEYRARVRSRSGAPLSPESKHSGWADQVFRLHNPWRSR